MLVEPQMVENATHPHPRKVQSKFKELHQRKIAPSSTEKMSGTNIFRTEFRSFLTHVECCCTFPACEAHPDRLCSLKGFEKGHVMPVSSKIAPAKHPEQL